MIFRFEDAVALQLATPEAGDVLLGQQRSACTADRTLERSRDFFDNNRLRVCLNRRRDQRRQCR